MSDTLLHLAISQTPLSPGLAYAPVDQSHETLLAVFEGEAASDATCRRLQGPGGRQSPAPTQIRLDAEPAEGIFNSLYVLEIHSAYMRQGADDPRHADDPGLLRVLLTRNLLALQYEIGGRAMRARRDELTCDPRLAAQGLGAEALVIPLHDRHPPREDSSHARMGRLHDLREELALMRAAILQPGECFDPKIMLT